MGIKRMILDDGDLSRSAFLFCQLFPFFLFFFLSSLFFFIACECRLVGGELAVVMCVTRRDVAHPTITYNNIYPTTTRLPYHYEHLSEKRETGEVGCSFSSM